MSAFRAQRVRQGGRACRRIVRGAGAGLVVALSLAAAAPADAQQLSPGGSLQQRFDGLQQPIGARFGAFTFLPRAEIDETFDDNIFATPSNRRGDMITTLTGSADINFIRGDDVVRATGRISDHEYAFNPRESEWEGGFGGIYTHELHNNLQFDAGAGLQRLIQPRTDPTGFNGLTPTTYMQYDGFIGGRYGDPLSNRLDLRIGITRVAYDSLQGIGGPIDTGVRDFREVYGVLRFQHHFFGQQDAFVELRPNTRNFDRNLDDSGFQRSSDGVRATTGGTFALDPVILLTLTTGFQAQNYNDPRFGSVFEPNGNFGVSWWPSRATNVSFNYTHQYQEEFFALSPGSIRNTGVIQLDHELFRNVLFTALGSLDRRDVIRSPTSITEERAEAKLQYQFAAGITAAVDYLYVRQQSTGATPFDANLFTVTLKKQF